MREASFLSAVMGLVFVLGLILLLSWLLKRFGSPVLSGCSDSKKKQITLLEARPIDPKNRLVLFRCRDKEYLMTTGESNMLIDSFPVISDNDEKAGTND